MQEFIPYFSLYFLVGFDQKMTTNQKLNGLSTDVCIWWGNLLLSSEDSQSTFGMLVKYLQEPPTQELTTINTVV